MLVDAGANINQVDGNGFTPLHVATSFNKIGSVEKLVAHDADLTLVDKSGLTPLGLALERNHGEIAAVLKAAGARD